MSAAHHIEWLSLIQKTGPFLAVSVLEEAFPQDLEAVDTVRRRRVRGAYEEWSEAVENEDPHLDALHREWIQLILSELLEYQPEVLKAGDEIPSELTYTEPTSGVVVRPEYALHSGEKTHLLVSCYVPQTDLDAPLVDSSWSASPIERMISLCRATGVRVGLVTNGELWSLVSAPADGSTSIGTWHARIWHQEPLTLRAFVSLPGVRRFFGQADGTLENLFAKSLEHQDGVTETLGEQVREAIEVLVQALDRADIDRNRELLKDVSATQLYEAGLTVMMRLVVLLCAEERRLLLLGDPIYDQNYAVSTLRSRLLEDKELFGEEVLERRHDAWSRLLALFRGIYGGIDHEGLRLPPLGGSLFDPDRFPFLEGRLVGSSWKTSAAEPLPIDNRTVLLLLNALQVLEQRAGAQLLTYESLDVEQIGHVYEGLLERTVKRVPEVTLGLVGSKKAINPVIALSELERLACTGEKTLLEALKELTGRSDSAIKNALGKCFDEDQRGMLLVACNNDASLVERIKPFAYLLRGDSWGYPLVYPQDAFIVAMSAGRRETGAHYTPKALTEPIVQHTLEPLVYVGPAEGLPQDQWKLKFPAELLALKICDMAMGSAAFLVQTCRWLAERLVESWDAEERNGKAISIEGEVLNAAEAAELLPQDKGERILIARRLVASRCLYGVDINPMAVELAKLSLWLITLMKGRPFGFLDHALKCGDALLGVTSLKQVVNFSLREGDSQTTFGTANLPQLVEEAAEKRRQLESLPSNDFSQIEKKNQLLREAAEATAKVKALADCLIAFELRGLDGKAYEEQMSEEASKVAAAISGTTGELQHYADGRLEGRRSFHWPVEFPEVFERGGFDAFVGNPPFIGNKYWAERLPDNFTRWAAILVGGRVGKIDVVVLFIRRTFVLMRQEGYSGLICTTTATEGESKSVGTGWLCEQGSLFRAVSSIPWPGTAGVHVCLLWFSRKKWQGITILDASPVESIAADLTTSAMGGNPFVLAKRLWGFQGSHNGCGECLLLKPNDVWFERLQEAKSPFLRPYITTDDIASKGLETIDRWVVDCEDFSLDEVKNQNTATWEFLVSEAERVRTKELLLPYKGLYQRWWQLWNHRAPLYRELRKREKCLVIPFVAKYILVVEIPTSWVFTNKLCVIWKNSPDTHAILLSNVFELWARKTGGTMGLTTMTLSLSKGVYTFPLPDKAIENADNLVNQRTLVFESSWKRLGPSFTDVINEVHNPKETTEDIIRLRELHRQIDSAVAAAYGWNDLDLGHGFHETKQGIRFTIRETARREVLDRLLALNHQRYTEEVAEGLHEKKHGKKKPFSLKPKKHVNSNQIQELGL